MMRNAISSLLKLYPNPENPSSDFLAQEVQCTSARLFTGLIMQNGVDFGSPSAMHQNHNHGQSNYHKNHSSGFFEDHRTKRK
ncbi:MAG: hypothetical protein K0B14_16160, partial [Anaerolineaceae bacterium]|nr:hypothetical protein [Anaerolineaceae bacterium]